MNDPTALSNDTALRRTLLKRQAVELKNDPQLQAIVELASSICAAPMAAVVVVDETTLWFKASKGLGDVTQLTKADSFCGYMVDINRALEVTDAQTDDRFSTSPLVTGSPFVRFYSGALVATQEYALGTLCVLDTVARSLTPDQRRALQMLSGLAGRIIETAAAYQRLRESEGRFTQLADDTPMSIWMTDAEGRLLYANRAWREFNGLTPEQARSGQWWARIHPDDREQMTAEIELANRIPGPLRVECRSMDIHGEYRHLVNHGRPRYDIHGRFAGYIGTCVDVTDERRAIAELQSVEERQRLVLEGSSDAAWDWDFARDHLYYSPRWWQMLGYAPNELPADAQLWLRLMHPEDRPRIQAMLDGIATYASSTVEVEFRLRHKNGHYVPILARGVLIRDAQGHPLRLAGTNSDLSERKRAEARRLEALTLLQKITEQIPGVVYQYQRWPDGRACFPYASEAIREIYRVSPQEVREDASAVTRIIHPDDSDAVTASIERSAQSLGIWDHEYRVRFDDGTVRWLHGNAVPQSQPDGSVLWHGFITDCTARKQIEQERESLAAQLRESQKMQAIGTLAGGIAHDFNNIAGTILGNVALAQQDVSGNAEAMQSLEQIARAAERSRALVHQILAFSRRQPTSRRVLAAATIVDEVVRLLRSTLLAPVVIECRAEGPVKPILADPVQVEQVLLNVMTNAAQAMEGKPGKIAVCLSPLEVTGGVEGQGMQVASGRYTQIAVTDTGHGMDAATLERIFEPFFTTKPVDTGTGLGLSVVYGIMMSHGGAVLVDSVPGEGSTFRLLFPEAGSGVAVPQVPVPPSPRPALEERPQRILYVDDDESLLMMVQRLLGRRGHRIIAVTSGELGLKFLRADPSAVDIVLLDYNMPGMNGIEVASAVRALRADLPIAIASGFVTDEMRAQAYAMGIRDVIFKPNAVQEYCDVVARIAAARS